ncbi:MAG: hypothetical protein AAF849_16840 [Bacteroidota bacterium]
MRRIFKLTLTILVFSTQLLTAQVAINQNNNNPDASAMLDLSSTDKGLLIPRMDSTARQNIAAPANGLVVYDTSTVTFWYYDNNKWNEVRNSSKVISYLDTVEISLSLGTASGARKVEVSVLKMEVPQKVILPFDYRKFILS